MRISATVCLAMLALAGCKRSEKGSAVGLPWEQPAKASTDEELDKASKLMLGKECKYADLIKLLGPGRVLGPGEDPHLIADCECHRWLSPHYKLTVFVDKHEITGHMLEPREVKP